MKRINLFIKRNINNVSKNQMLFELISEENICK
jgi:hypothetical protein